MPLPHRTLLVAGLLSLSAGVTAQPPGPSPTGGPGALVSPRPATTPATRTDLKARLEAAFDRMDVTKDGRVDGQDRDARRSERVARAFDPLDADDNGAISKDEFAAAREARPARDGGPMRPGRRALMMRGGPGGAATPAAMTKSAFVDRGLARFDSADSDRDGTLSASERRAARGAMHGAGPRRRAPHHLPPARHMPPPPEQ